jgi:hypothetical protein
VHRKGLRVNHLYGMDITDLSPVAITIFKPEK